MYNLLSDLSIIEVSSFVASPTAGLYCAQMGAEVIRVDQIGGGLDYDRYQLTEDGRSLSWENLNRAKKSVALDLRQRRGARTGGGTGARHRTAHHQCAGKQLPVAETPFAPDDDRMITVRIMGWGDGRQAMDFTVNAASGYPLMTGPADWDRDTAPPVNQTLPAWDFITGAYTAFTLLAALRHRDSTGEGGEDRIPLGDVAIGTIANSGAMAEMLYRGGDRERLGNAIWGAFGRDFRSRDGQRFMVAALTDKQWAALLDRVRRGERDRGGRKGPRCQFRQQRPQPLYPSRRTVRPVPARGGAVRLYAIWLREWRRRARHSKNTGPCIEAATDPELVGDNPLFGPSTANPSGFDYPAPGAFANQADAPRDPARPAPYLGQHSEEVLAERLGHGIGRDRRADRQGRGRAIRRPIGRRFSLQLRKAAICIAAAHARSAVFWARLPRWRRARWAPSS